MELLRVRVQLRTARDVQRLVSALKLLSCHNTEPGPGPERRLPKSHAVEIGTAATQPYHQVMRRLCLLAPHGTADLQATYR